MPIIINKVKREFLTNRSFSLDLVRSLAIFIVVFYHVSVSVFHLSLPGVWYLAYMGVDIFFGLSGYLIGKILLKILNKCKWKLSKTAYANFLIRRILRTVPLYYFMLFLNYFFFSLNTSNKANFNMNYLFWLQNLTEDCAIFFGESWSLAVEEHFYFWVPLCFMCLSYLIEKFAHRKYVSSESFNYYLFALLIVLGVLHFIVQLNSFQQIRIVIFRLDSILMGVLVSLFSNKIFTKKLRLRYLFFAILILLLAIILLLFKSETADFSKLYFPLSGLGFAIIIGYVEHWKVEKFFPLFLIRIVEYLSRVSYSLYLVNLFVLSLVTKHITSHFEFSNLQHFLISIILILFFSHVVHNLIEKPFLDLREKYFPSV